MSIKFEGNKLSRLYSAQINSIAYGNENAVTNGCLVSQTTIASMSVDVAGGSIFFGATNLLVVGQNVAIAANVTANTRIDLVVIDNTGTVSVVGGTPAVLPLTPDYDPDSYIVLAMVEVKPGVSEIISADILDLRTLNIGGAGGSGSTTSVGLQKYTETFTGETTLTITHNLSDEEPIVEVYDDSSPPEIVIPSNIQIIDSNNVTITFSGSTSGTVVIHGGVTGGSSIYTTSVASSTPWNITHNLNNLFPIVKIYNNSTPPVDITNTATSITAVDANNIEIVFAGPTAGTVVVSGGTAYLEIDKALDVKTANKDDGSILQWNEEQLKYTHSPKFDNRYTTVLSGHISTSGISANFNISSLLKCNAIEIYNTGPSACYITLTSTATTSGMKLLSGTSLVLQDVNFNFVSAITSSGTANVNVTAYSSEFTGKKSNSQILNLSATAASSFVSFTDVLSYKDILIQNIGSHEVFVAIGNTANLNDILIQPDDVAIFRNIAIQDIAAICNVGETTTVRILGIY